MGTERKVARLLPATCLALAIIFAWATWLSFSTTARSASGLSALAGLAVGAEIVNIARSPKLVQERTGLLFAAAALGLGSASYFPSLVGGPLRITGGIFTGLATVFLALAAGRRLRKSRTLGNGSEMRL